MAIKIYGRLSSANVQKINWFCEYANINVINLNYGGIHGKTQTTNYFILYESKIMLGIIWFSSNKSESSYIPHLQDR